jgi:hypothetical protein
MFLALLAVLSISAIASASASACTSPIKCEWEVQTTEQGTPYKPVGSAGTESEYNVESSGGAFKLKAGTLEVTCTSVTDFGEIEAGGKDEADAIWFRGCTTNETGCKIKSKGHAKVGEIVVIDVETQLVEREPGGGGAKKLTDEFKEHANGEFVTLETGKKRKVGHFTMEEACTNFPATTKVEGQIAAEVIEIPETEVGVPLELNPTEVELNFPVVQLKGNTLKAFAKNATISGKSVQKLIPGEGFGHKAS